MGDIIRNIEIHTINKICGIISSLGGNYGLISGVLPKIPNKPIMTYEYQQ